MAYLTTAHVFREKPDFSRLAELPKSIGYRAYLHRAAKLYLLDTFRTAKAPKYPFQTLIPSADIPLELSPEFEVLERLYARLGALELADAFKRSYINGAVAAIQYAQGLMAVTNPHRLSAGIGRQDVLPGVDADLFAGGMFRDSAQLGAFTSTSVESYWIGLGLTWRFSASRATGRPCRTTGTAPASRPAPGPER